MRYYAMEIHRSFKGGGNRSPKESEMGLMGKDQEMFPEKALFMVRRGRVLDK